MSPLSQLLTRGAGAAACGGLVALHDLLCRVGVCEGWWCGVAAVCVVSLTLRNHSRCKVSNTEAPSASLAQGLRFPLHWRADAAHAVVGLCQDRAALTTAASCCNCCGCLPISPSLLPFQEALPSTSANSLRLHNSWSH